MNNDLSIVLIFIYSVVFLRYFAFSIKVFRQKNKKIFILGNILLIALPFFTNPSFESHKKKMTEELVAGIKSEVGKNNKENYSNYDFYSDESYSKSKEVLDDLFSTRLNLQNYLLASTTSINTIIYGEKNMGFGFMGNVINASSELPINLIHQILDSSYRKKTFSRIGKTEQETFIIKDLEVMSTDIGLLNRESASLVSG